MRHRWRVIVSALIFIAGLWAYLAVVEIRNPDSAIYLHSDESSISVWPRKTLNTSDGRVDTASKLP